MSNHKKISIIVVAYDNPFHLERTLRTLLHNTEYPLFELIISDNSAGIEKIEEQIHDICSKYINKGAIYVKNPENLYHGKGCMAGFYKSSGEYICFCNDDIFIPASQLNWLHRMASYVEAAPKVATLTPALYGEKEGVYWVGKTDPTKPHHDLLHVPRGDPRIPTEPRETCYNNMAVMLTRRYLVEEFPIGQSCPHYGSDSEFCNRIKERYPDMVHMVLPEVKLYHYNIYYKRTNKGKDKFVEG